MTLNKNNILSVSANTLDGINLVKDTIYDMVINSSALESKVMITNERHLESIRSAIYHIDTVLDGISMGNTLDLVSIDLNNVWYSLGEITGDTNNETIIDKIFKDFCVGK